MSKEQDLWMIFDLETMSTKANAVVLSMGMILFDINKRQSFDDLLANTAEIFFQRTPQMEKDRHVSHSTLEWWGKQSMEAQQVLHVPEEECVHPRKFYPEFLIPYYEKHDINLNWAQKHLNWASRGTHFDAAILADMFDNFNVTEPWKFWNLVDTRSYLLANEWTRNAKLVKPDNMNAHDAKHDVAFEAMMIQTAVNVPFDKIDFDESRRKQKWSA